MKKIILILCMCISLHQGVFAQAAGSGMQQSATPFNFFSHLNRPTGFLGPLLSEKAIGVYHANVTPVSFLEINTNPTMFTTPKLPSVANMGEVFSTNSPVDGFWRMKLANVQIGRIFSNSNNFKLDGSAGDLIFQTGGADRVWIKSGTGRMGINTNLPTTRLDINGDLRIRVVNNNNTFNQVLVIDPSGDVFWRDASTLGSFLCPGVKCNSTCGGLQPSPSVFEVNNDVNLSSSVLNQGYRIGCEVVVQKPGTDNIYIGQEAGRLSNPAVSSFNSFLGSSAGLNNKGDNNTFVGYSAGISNNTGQRNTFGGSKSGFNNLSGNMNTFYGYVSGFSNQNGIADVFLGDSAGYFTNGGSFNTFTGHRCGLHNIGGAGNSFYGKEAGYSNVSGNSNTYVGAHSAQTGTTGLENSFLGVNTGFYSNGDQNTFGGAEAGFNNATGFGNSFYGWNAGSTICGTPNAGSYNTYVGHNSMSVFLTSNNCKNFNYSSTLGTNTEVGGDFATAIGANCFAPVAKTMLLGDNNINVGIGLSADVTGPQKKLEIKDNTVANPLAANSTTTPASFGASGLRFTNLTAATSPITNPGKGVLALTAAGDVIYVRDSVGGTDSSCCIGNFCSSPGSNPLGGSWEVPMAGFNYNFTMPAASPSFVSIGHTSCPTGLARLDVMNDNYTTAGAFVSSFASTGNVFGGAFRGVNTGTGAAFGLSATALAANTSVNAIGVNARSVGTSSFDNIGVNAATANGSHASIGINADISASTSPINQGYNTEITANVNAAAFNTGISATINSIGDINRGGEFIVQGASNVNYGVEAVSTNITTMNTNVGVLGRAVNAGTVNDNVAVAGIGTNSGTINNSTTSIPNNIGLYGEGDIAAYLVGPTVTSGPPIIFSDSKLKTNVKTISSALELIEKLNPVTYNFKSKEFPELHLQGDKQYGFIAQEVEKVLPELVQQTHKPEFKDKDGNVISAGGDYKGVEYTSLIPVLTRALQEQQEQIEKQQQQIAQQQQQLDELKSLMTAQSGAGSGSKLAVELSDKNVVVLNQNVPNPFAENTVITYNIPDSFGAAQILFYDNGGKLIKTVDITKKGKGALTVFANDLSNGMYSYTLVVDGKVIDTKKMLKQQ